MEILDTSNNKVCESLEFSTYQADPGSMTVDPVPIVRANVVGEAHNFRFEFTLEHDISPSYAFTVYIPNN